MACAVQTRGRRIRAQASTGREHCLILLSWTAHAFLPTGADVANVAQILHVFVLVLLHRCRDHRSGSGVDACDFNAVGRIGCPAVTPHATQEGPERVSSCAPLPSVSQSSFECRGTCFFSYSRAFVLQCRLVHRYVQPGAQPTVSDAVPRVSHSKMLRAVGQMRNISTPSAGLNVTVQLPQSILMRKQQKQQQQQQQQQAQRQPHQSNQQQQHQHTHNNQGETAPPHTQRKVSPSTGIAAGFMVSAKSPQRKRMCRGDDGDSI